jgi:cytoskeletal protein CcmA (bactofilin family)
MPITWAKEDKIAPAAPPPPLKVEEPRAPQASPSRPDPDLKAAIGKSLIVKAQISGEEDLYVDGQLEGTIELKNNDLTVGINGRVNANVIARNVFVDGNLTGNVVASDKVEIRKTGSLQGDLTTGGVTIEDGAYFKGSIDIARPK